MDAKAYRALVSRILKLYGRKLNMMRVDACELADLVYFGDESECALLASLEKAAQDGAA